MIPYFHSGILPTTLNNACRQSKQSEKKNIIFISKVVTFQATPKFLGMKSWRKCCMESTRWTISKAFFVIIDVMDRCYFSVDFCALSSSFCCIILESSPSLMIISSFYYIFCTLYSSSLCSAKASWTSLDISALYFGGIETTILPIISEQSYFTVCSEIICCDLFWLSVSKIVLLMLQQYGNDCVVIYGR